MNEERKIYCPLQVRYESNQDRLIYPCVESECGFWDDMAECCAMRNISQNLEKLFLKGSV